MTLIIHVKAPEVNSSLVIEAQTTSQSVHQDPVI